jgi:hypothetical protein
VEQLVSTDEKPSVSLLTLDKENKLIVCSILTMSNYFFTTMHRLHT